MVDDANELLEAFVGALLDKFGDKAVLVANTQMGDATGEARTRWSAISDRLQADQVHLAARSR